MAYLVYLLESDLDRARLITEKAPGKEFRVEAVADLQELYRAIQKNVPDAVFVGFRWIQPQLDRVKFTKEYVSFVYGEGIEIDNRLRLYRQGVDRVLEWSEKCAGNMFTLLKIRFYRDRELFPYLQKFVTRGKLSDFNLFELLGKAIFSKKNYIFKLLDGEWTAKMRVYRGEIIEALAPPLRGEEAAIAILLHRNGQLRMQPFVKDSEISTLSASTPGILAEAQYEAQMIRRFAAGLPGGNPVFQITGTLPIETAEERTQTILHLVEKEKSLLNILQKSPYSVLKTFRILESLYRKGHIQLDKSFQDEMRFNENDIEVIRHKLFPPGVVEGRLVVLGFPGSGKTQLIKTLAGSQKEGIKTVQSLDFTRLKLPGGLRLNVFGVSVDEYFQPIMQKLSENMLGYIFVLDASQQENLEYVHYLIHQMLSKYHVPMAVAVTGVRGDVEKVLQFLRQQLHLPPEVPLLPVNPEDFHQVRQIFYQMMGREVIQES